MIAHHLKVKAVIFDMDGLMVDTEHLHYLAFKKVLNDVGRDYSEEENNKLYIGRSDHEEALDMVKRFDVPLTPDALVKRKQTEYIKLFSDAIVPMPGLMELLEKLKASGYKMAVASSSYLKIIKMILEGLGVDSYFAAIASGEQVKNSKPSPDIFLLAAERLGVEPSECLVLEDAPNGIKAAKAAGMQVFAIPSSATKDGDFQEADKKLTSLSEVFAQINFSNI